MKERRPNRKPKEKLAAYEGQIYGDTDGRNSYRVDFIIALCEQGKLGPVTALSLSKLLVDGHLEGDSDEPDDSEPFISRVRGLTLEKYQQGNYPPILVGKMNGGYHIVDGRHRAVNLLTIIKQNNLNTDTVTLKCYIIDFDNPEQRKLLKKAKIENWR